MKRKIYTIGSKETDIPRQKEMKKVEDRRGGERRIERKGKGRERERREE